MSAITPNSEIRILKCPIESDNQNQITFPNINAQYTYFSGLNYLTLENASYQRKEGIIRYPEHIDNILEYNYVMYQNKNYSNKWFYAFITKMDYVNDKMTNIYIKQDVFQTWQFDLIYKECFVEREHVNDDTIGKHTVPEGLETGEYIINSVEEMDVRSGDYFICMGVSDVPTNTPGITDDRTYGGIYSGLTYLLFDNATNCSKMIKAFDKAGKNDAIYTIFMIPTSLSFSNTWYTATLEDVSNIKFAIATTSSTPVSMVSNKTISINSTLDSYTPKNNKLRVYPYNYLYVTNNSGGDAIYRYEEFTGTPNFNIDGVISTGCSIKLYPTNYKKYSHQTWTNSEFCFGLNGGKYPSCSWNSDAYTNWLTANGTNVFGVNLNAEEAGYIGGIMQTAIGVAGATAGYTAGVGGIFTGIGTVFNTMKESYRHSIAPDQARGDVNSGDITASSKMIGFYAYKMSIKSEYASIIDNYFSMYGYKINELKIPNITGRTNWNYVKTINAIIEGNVPQEYLEEIKELFNRGITLWHTTQYYLDYSRTNSIVS